MTEEKLQAALAEEPDHGSAVHNLRVVWLSRDGKAADDRIRARLEQLRRDHPDYVFAALTLGQLAIEDGDPGKARELLTPTWQNQRLHITEARALFMAQVQLHLDDGRLEDAEAALQMLEQISDEDAELQQHVRSPVRDSRRLQYQMAQLAKPIFGRRRTRLH